MNKVSLPESILKYLKKLPKEWDGSIKVNYERDCPALGIYDPMVMINILHRLSETGHIKYKVSYFEGCELWT